MGHESFWQFEYMGKGRESFKITPSQLVQRFAASSILPAVQNHRDGGLKRFTAHGIVAAAAGDHHRQLVLIFLNGIDCRLCLPVVYPPGIDKLVSILPVVADEHDLFALNYFQVPTRLVADRPEINSSKLGVFPDRFCPIILAIRVSVIPDLNQRFITLAPVGYLAITVFCTGTR